ncbi:Dolichyl-phosphate-mannose--protein mannosyltransferase 1 [Neolecta irregularis DAH-3]|uniref:Dolichyl-phosphate-mannose--protein mannosyltransferase n=1 Tax=Neolecta irregularis (strain DAH-3) TaxID=1198029 RepID=A0A1U7LJU5_NEOID|nr:Dolichyl-phosphate-mannose--protein mannosyltransferase 1 [Neolecta irregularis DAH-3]|eukprot:OLL22863.1 Dolichyl-phosphate-mannose--protein mannosyltransferase 1 [Neolecta irregularis DAH-3]
MAPSSSTYTPPSQNSSSPSSPGSLATTAASTLRISESTALPRRLLTRRDYLAPRVPYVMMRFLLASFGILVVPTTFLILKASNCATTTAFLGAAIVTFENSFITQSRFILLDSPLIAFTALTVLFWTTFQEFQHSPFSYEWWLSLTLTGLALGATCSVKWVGLFVIAWVGLLTIHQLWTLLADLNITITLFSRHLAARVLCLILLPVIFYASIFYLHFEFLPNPGDGDDVAIGSKVTLRHLNTQGGYLHSHAHNYPTGSGQQQITLYPHKDENNEWIIGNYTDLDPNSLDLQYISNGAFIRLKHAVTEKRLHSHDHHPPVTEADWQKEVSAYGFPGFPGDANDNFRIEIVEQKSRNSSSDRVHTIDTVFRLVHQLSGCALFSHRVKLPDWGFEQQEVVCATSGTLPNSLWYFETNQHPQFDENIHELVSYSLPGFWGKFWELQKVMWTMNAGLTSSHPYESRPSAWPFLYRGINFWDRARTRVYLFGNPLVWWTATFSIILYFTAKLFAVLRWQRGYDDSSNCNRLEKVRLEYGYFHPGLGITLSSLFPHVSPAFSASLSPRAILFNSCLLSPLGFYNDSVDHESSGRSSIDRSLFNLLGPADNAKKSLGENLGISDYDGYNRTWPEEDEKSPTLHTSPDKSDIIPDIIPDIIQPHNIQPDNIKPKLPVGAVVREEIVYRDLDGNQISKEELDNILQEQGDKISLKTVYSTRIETARVNNIPPPAQTQLGETETNNQDEKDDEKDDTNNKDL